MEKVHPNAICGLRKNIESLPIDADNEAIINKINEIVIIVNKIVSSLKHRGLYNR